MTFFTAFCLSILKVAAWAVPLCVAACVYYRVVKGEWPS